MVKEYRNIALEGLYKSMSEAKIKIKNLYKIFGKDPEGAMEHVKNGVGKDELLEKHNHVLGLKDINLDIHEKSIQVVMGLSGSGKINSYSPHQ